MADDILPPGRGPMGEHRTVTATLRDASANPGPLGLMAFGMTTVLLNIHNAGIFELNTMILAMGIFYGGIAQVIAGIMEWKKNSTFGMTAFLSYGLFWLTLVGLIVLPGWTDVEAASETAMGYYLLAWGVFTGLMFIGTLRINRALQAVFFTLTVLFVLLAIRDWTGSETIGTIAGWEGILTGLTAVYASIAQVWNELYGRTVLPLGVVNK
jgi:succinate-acetate transporter protein